MLKNRLQALPLFGLVSLVNMMSSGRRIDLTLHAKSLTLRVNLMWCAFDHRDAEQP